LDVIRVPSTQAAVEAEDVPTSLSLFQPAVNGPNAESETVEEGLQSSTSGEKVAATDR
jgi:hypothetical protein